MIYNMYYKYNYIFLSCRFYRLYIEQKKLSFCNFYDHYIYRSYKKFLSLLLLLTSLPQATNDSLKLHSPNEGPLNVHYIYSKYTLFQITSIWQHAIHYYIIIYTNYNTNKFSPNFRLLYYILGH